MEKQEIIKKEAEELLTRLNVEFELEVSKKDETFVVQITSDADAPYLIGKYGETLSAIQRILEAILFKAFNERIDVLVNINDYQEKQKERLIGIVENIVQKVMSEKKEAAVPSLSSYERKLIHEYISQNYKELKSYSEGEGPDRKLIISPNSTS